MKIGIIDLCKQIEDPRMNRKKVHKMETIIYISIAAVICGAQSWNEIEEFGNAKIAFFKSRIPALSTIDSLLLMEENQLVREQLKEAHECIISKNIAMWEIVWNKIL